MPTEKEVSGSRPSSVIWIEEDANRDDESTFATEKIANLSSDDDDAIALQNTAITTIDPERIHCVMYEMTRHKTLVDYEHSPLADEVGALAAVDEAVFIE